MNKNKMLKYLIDSDLQLISAHFNRQTYAAGETIFSEGVVLHALHLLVSGSVKVVRNNLDKEVVVAQLGPGELLGVTSLLDGSTISATVITVEPCEFDWIAFTDLHSLLELVPGLATRFYRSLGSVLADRLDTVLNQVTLPPTH
ncbi:Crp/Fnr family transcriptional regulator [Candidatus Magnetaquicoccus inordinatus]|uniref:Crp/Fnr family transcriptional regulator n=1 Tax=Candidatus Magnetaquicoccus inordinatus TaxID=2496818 RepID=UPI00187D6322|nr:cyclic nucleotide-binding domain-containing protein [Candidatus Magnetaquicoccus inordinatus]